MSIELRNAFETSMAERRAEAAENGTDDALINEQVSIGRFVLAAYIERYCPRTDALMGFDRIFESAHDSREGADAALAAMEEAHPGYAAEVSILAPPVRTCEPRPEDAPF